MILDYTSITYEEVDPDQTTRLLFAQSGHSLCQKYPMPVPSTWQFFLQERVRVHLLAPLLGEGWERRDRLQRKTHEKIGHIRQVESRRCMVEFDDGVDLWVDLRNLHKVIRVGDLVEVIGGIQSGQMGLVLESANDTVGILSRNQENIHETTVLTTHVNMCRLTQVHLRAPLPWINEHVTIMKGTFLNYTGTVVDVHLPNPFTVLEVFIPQLLYTVKVRHDYVIHTQSNRLLRHAQPLSTTQQAFRQGDWDIRPAPNLQSGSVDLEPVGEAAINHQYQISVPPAPWIGVEVLVIKGELKGRGFVKSVEHQKHARSGLGLNEAYPLRGRQRYYEPVCKVSAVPAQPLTFRSLTPPPRVATPPILTEGAILDSGPWHPSAPVPLPWPLHPELDGKRFLATYRCRGEGSDYSVKKGLEVEASPEDISPWLDNIDPSRTQKAMLVKGGPHLGKYMRPITNKYSSDGKALFTAKTFVNWGRPEEALADEWIEVAPEDLAQIPDDPNEKRWDSLMKSAREAAPKPRPPRKHKK
ncbi:hypothetical protein VKT23_019520 [Stygiomarasmius scandens]|uniref:Uncharacterized protein n=1 Tax=Marasmiellus scandens TaxID=2682957 RepID=A0ABR1IQ37_9AGAR